MDDQQFMSWLYVISRMTARARRHCFRAWRGR
jgi:hypothetical protein